MVLRRQLRPPGRGVLVCRQPADHCGSQPLLAGSTAALSAFDYLIRHSAPAEAAGAGAGATADQALTTA